MVHKSIEQVFFHSDSFCQSNSVHTSMFAHALSDPILRDLYYEASVMSLVKIIALSTRSLGPACGFVKPAVCI